MATITSFTATPASVGAGQGSALTWAGTADTFSIDQGIGAVTGTSLTVFPAATTIYTLTATDIGGSTTATVTVTVTAGGSVFGTTPWGDVIWDDPAPAAAPTGGGGGGGGTVGGTTGGTTPGASFSPPTVTDFTPSVTTASPGDPVTFTFATDGATQVTISPDVGVVASDGTITVHLDTTTTFTITAINDFGAAQVSVTITVAGAAAENIRYHQIRRNDREGDGKQLQMYGGEGAVSGWPAVYDVGQNVNSKQPRGNTMVVQLADQTGGFTEDDLLAFDSFGNAKDSGISAASLSTISNGGTIGAWYGQVPRGTRNGSNTQFHLDYTLGSPYTILTVNGIGQTPAVDGPSGLSPHDYSITGNLMTMTDAPKASDYPWYIWYFIGSPPQPISATYAHTHTLTIDHTKVANTDQANYPLMFAGSYGFLRRVTSGGEVENASGYDIVFSLDSAGTQLLDYERVLWNGITGDIEIYVRVPVLSHTADTVIYVLVGSTGITTDQSNRTGVWDSHYRAVWHFGDGATLDVTDSTANGNNGTNNGVTAAAGLLSVPGGSALFDSSSGNYIHVGAQPSLAITSGLTIQALTNWSGPGSSNQSIVGKGYPNAAGYDFAELIGYPELATNAYGLINSPSLTGPTQATGTFYLLWGAYDGSATQRYVGLFGSLFPSSGPTWGANALGDNSLVSLEIGATTGTGGVPARFWNGYLDEVRISDIGRSSDWITTEANNLINPTTFYTVV